MTTKKSVTLNSVLVCGRCNIVPVDHEVTERQKYKMVKNDAGIEVFEATDKNGKRIPLPRAVTTDKHCPSCFNQSNFKYVLPDQVRVYKNERESSKTN